MVLTGLDIGPSPTASEIARTLSDTLDRAVRYADPGALRYLRHARSVLHMEWGMVAVTTAIHTVARLGRAGGITDDVRQVTGRDPVSFEAFARTHADAWRP